MLNGEVMIIHLIAGLIKKIWCDSNVRVKKTLVALQCMKMSKFFPKLYKPFARGINVKLGLSNYATKTDIKNISPVDSSSFALKTNLATCKTEVDKLYIDKLVPVPVDLSKQSDVVKNYVVKKTLHDKLVAKVNEVPLDNIDTIDFVLKTKYQTGNTELENKIPDTSSVVKKTDYNTKITELENKIPDVNYLATKSALTTVANKIPGVSNLVKKKQTITLKLQKLKINLIIIIMANILILKSLIN